MKLCFLFSPLLIRYFRPLTSGRLAGHGSCVLFCEWREFSKVGQLLPCESDHCNFLLSCVLIYSKFGCGCGLYMPVTSVSGTKRGAQRDFHLRVCVLHRSDFCWKYAQISGLWNWTCLQIKYTAAENVLEYWRTWKCREATTSNFTPDMLPITRPRLGGGTRRADISPFSTAGKNKKNGLSFTQDFK